MSPLTYLLGIVAGQPWPPDRYGRPPGFLSVTGKASTGAPGWRDTLRHATTSRPMWHGPVPRITTTGPRARTLCPPRVSRTCSQRQVRMT